MLEGKRRANGFARHRRFSRHRRSRRTEPAVRRDDVRSVLRTSARARSGAVDRRSSRTVDFRRFRARRRSTKRRPSMRSERLVRHGVTSIAVALLFSFRNRAHERRVGELIARKRRTSTSRSPATWRRKFASTSASRPPSSTRISIRSSNTTLVSWTSGSRASCLSLGAALHHAFERRRRDVSGRRRARSVQTILSGPAAGVVAASAARSPNCRGFPNVVTFDMGGTSTDVALIENGRPVRRSRRQSPRARRARLDARHPYGRRRRRNDRLDRYRRRIASRPARVPAQNPGPAVLRPRRHRADDNRRQRRARRALAKRVPLAGGTLRLDRAAAENGDPRTHRRAARHIGHRGGARHRRNRQREDARSDQGRVVQPRLRSARFSLARVRRRGRDPRRRRWPENSACAAFSCRPFPA